MLLDEPHNPFYFNTIPQKVVVSNFVGKCPYCSHRIKAWTDTPHGSEYNCHKCSRVFDVLLTDFNNHSPHEISEHFPCLVFKMGELTAFTVRKEQRFCEVCGTFYRQDENVCPNLLEEIVYWYHHPEVISNKTDELDPDLVQGEIKVYLAANFKDRVVRRIINGNLKKKKE